MNKNPDLHIGKNIQYIRRARGLTQEGLAKLANVPYATLIKVESGAIKNPSVDVISKIAIALDMSIDSFTLINRHQGDEAILRIFDDARAVLARGDCMYLSGIDEKMYESIVKRELKQFISDLKSLGVRQCILSKEGDRYRLKGEHLEYRWIPERFFSPTPIYAYKDRMATLTWGPPLESVILVNQHLAESYRRQFLFMWENAKRFRTGG